MRIKKIYAKNMTEALRKVKAELGEDAVILKTKRVSGTGLFAGQGIEVTAAVDWEGTRREAKPVEFTPPVQPGATDTPPRRLGVERQAAATYEPSAHRSAAGAEVDELRDELQRMRSMLGHLTEMVRQRDGRHVPLELRTSFAQLTSQGVTPEVAEKVIASIADSLSPKELLQPALVRQHLERQVGLCFRTARPMDSASKPQVIAVVGPTGVGKTTTIAKLAARARVFDGRSVGLISTDTYRIAAVEQLRTFAEIADIPLEVVYTPDEMKRALRKFAYSDQVYIDTTGRSPYASGRIRELQEMVEAAQPSETHLALSLATRDEDQLDVLERYRPLRYNRLLFTKIDETCCPGSLLNIAFHAELPVSYVTNGQGVPNDLIVAERRTLASLVLGEFEPEPLLTGSAA